MENPVTKFTLKEWVKHPTTILLIVVTLLAWGILTMYVNSQLEQVKYLRERVTKLEKQLDEYTTANLIQRGVITQLADSLATKKDGI